MPVPVLPSMRGLAALHALACEKSLEKAAARLGVTRSAVSHRIAGLESELGVALTRKRGRSAALTEDGEALLAAVGDALERIEGAFEPFLRRRRELRLSTVATFASLWLIPRLPPFQVRWPRIELSIATTRRAVDFAAEDWDCAIRHGLGAWPGVAATLLFKETLVPVATPEVAERIGELGARPGAPRGPSTPARAFSTGPPGKGGEATSARRRTGVSSSRPARRRWKRRWRALASR